MHDNGYNRALKSGVRVFLVILKSGVRVFLVIYLTSPIRCFALHLNDDTWLKLTAHRKLSFEIDDSRVSAFQAA